LGPFFSEATLGTASGADLGAGRFQIMFWELFLGATLGTASGADLGAGRFQILF